MGVIVEVHGSVWVLIELGFGAMGEFDRTGRRGPVSSSEHVPCLPGHGDGATGVRWHA